MEKSTFTRLEMKSLVQIPFYRQTYPGSRNEESELESITEFLVGRVAVDISLGHTALSCQAFLPTNKIGYGIRPCVFSFRISTVMIVLRLKNHAMYYNHL